MDIVRLISTPLYVHFLESKTVTNIIGTMAGPLLGKPIPVSDDEDSEEESSENSKT